MVLQLCYTLGKVGSLMINLKWSFFSVREEFRLIVLSLEKMHRDGKQLVNQGSANSKKKLRQRIGVKPCLEDCLDGLMRLHDMHQSE